MAKPTFLPKKRQSNVRDPKLIIIATEGKCSEKQYFEALRVRRGKTNIHIHVLATQDNRSSPDSVLQRLNEFKSYYSLKESRDELWMVIDVDKWGDSKLSNIARRCKQKGYFLAVSNPCFELWLLMHVKKLSDYSDHELEKIKDNEKTGSRTYLEVKLIEVFGTYNKSKLIPGRYIPHIESAIDEAKRLDIDRSERWPSGLGTRVHLLAEKIAKPPYIR
jgi:hypothetical protein